MIKALVTLALTATLTAGSGGLGTDALFAERLGEYKATVHGIEVAHAAHVADPGNARTERAIESLTEHCLNLVALYNTGTKSDPDLFTDARLPQSLSSDSCE